jgi:hypothetical protein
MRKVIQTSFVLGLIFSASAFSETQIYPWKPIPAEEIKTKAQYLSEDKDAFINVFQIDKRGLSEAKTKNHPWSGPYWALKQGMIANPYLERTPLQYFHYLPTVDGIKPYDKRRNYVMTNFAQLSEKELARLAPSEKYDILMGTELDLSNRIWDFINKWKNDMKWDFMTSIELPDQNYEIEKKNYIVANWEGVCHGWAPASGVIPKPEKTVTVALPDGRKLPFYPEDIKGLVSLTWANSLIQDNVLSEGFRCKRRFPKQDAYGRFYDDIEEEGALFPRCGDIHPAIMHVTLANVTGYQGRSFIIDKDPRIAVSNQPVVSYSFKYFDVRDGRDNILRKAAINYESYRRIDPFEKSRNPNVKFIVGVESTIVYADWTLIKKPSSSSYLKDETSKLVSLYDLELDADGNIIGGQWRSMRDLTKVGMNNNNLGSAPQTPMNSTRPDFLWVVPKNYKSYFKGISGLEDWKITSGEEAPESWRRAAVGAHSFIYNMSSTYGNSDRCKVKNIETGEVKEVPCEFKYPRPQPLINVVDQLVELSKR